MPIETVNENSVTTTTDSSLNSNSSTNPLLENAPQSIAQSIFGDSAGPCWGDFFCTNNRIRGRLYATSRSILFYSTLLGFERRFILPYRDIIEMELHRTTSIKIVMFDCEVYIFRSFENREQVLDLLKGLKALSDRPIARAVVEKLAISGGKSAIDSVPILPPIPTQEPVLHASRSTSSFEFPPFPFSASQSTPPIPNRRRAISDSIVRFPARQQSHNNILSNSIESEENSSQPENDAENSFSIRLEEDIMDDAAAADLTEIKKRRFLELTQVGVQSETIQCSLEKFFDCFLADNAPYSLVRYQRDYRKDLNVQITKWTTDLHGNLTRTITFIHPIKTVGVGTTEAYTTRHQVLKRYGKHGIALQNTTLVEGVPAADSFSVKDFWCIEAKEDVIHMSVRFDTCFTKRVFIRAMVEKSVRKETKNWFAGYLEMVREALLKQESHQKKSSQTQEEECALVQSAPTEKANINLHSAPYILWVIVALLVMILVVLTMLFSSTNRLLSTMERLVAICSQPTQQGIPLETSSQGQESLEAFCSNNV